MNKHRIEIERRKENNETPSHRGYPTQNLANNEKTTSLNTQSKTQLTLTLLTADVAQ